MPAPPREHARGRLRMLGTRGLGLEQDASLGVLALAVEQVELVGDVGGATFVLGEDQLESGVGALEAGGGVDARGEPEAEACSVTAPGSTPEFFMSARSPGFVVRARTARPS